MLLEMIASGEAPQRVLDHLAVELERHLGGRCSILVFRADSGTLHHAAAPSLPPAYCRAIDGAERRPCCGIVWHRRVSEAAGRRDRRDDRPAVGRLPPTGGEHGFRACWSTPVMSPDGDVLGTFAVYHDRPHTPTHGRRRPARRVLAAGERGAATRSALLATLGQRASIPRQLRDQRGRDGDPVPRRRGHRRQLEHAEAARRHRPRRRRSQVRRLRRRRGGAADSFGVRGVRRRRLVDLRLRGRRFGHPAAPWRSARSARWSTGGTRSRASASASSTSPLGTTPKKNGSLDRSPSRRGRRPRRRARRRANSSMR